jgi:cobalamin biosynthesis protein CbiD
MLLMLLLKATCSGVTTSAAAAAAAAAGAFYEVHRQAAATSLNVEHLQQRLFVVPDGAEVKSSNRVPCCS